MTRQALYPFWFILALGAIAVTLALFIRPAHAGCSLISDGLMVCDDGRAFQRMGDDVVVDDSGHAWVRERTPRGDYIHTDQAYSTPLIEELWENENEEWADESED